MRSALPLLHFNGAYPEGFLHSTWAPDAQVVMSGFLLIAGYLLITGPLNRRYPGSEQRPVTRQQRWCFLSGAIVMTIMLGPPFDDWGDYYLVTVNMIQHLVLMLAVAPLLLLGIPPWFYNPINRRPVLERIGREITRPITAFLLANVLMLVWHLPSLYDAALRQPPIHAAQHSVFVIVGMLAWYPICGTNPAWPRAAPLVQCLLLFLETFPGGMLGAMITLTAPGLYDFYDNAPRLWGIGLATDQLFAGLSMWVGLPVVYLTALSVLFLRCAGREEAKDRATPAQRVVPKPDTASFP